MKGGMPLFILIASITVFVAIMIAVLSLINVKSRNEAERQGWFMFLKVVLGTIAITLIVWLLVR